jgi:hypothetical protein
VAILQHIGLSKVREKAKRVSGICEKPFVLATFVRHATDRWTILYRPGLALRVPKPRKNTFYRSRYFPGKQCLTSQLAENGLVVEPHRVRGLCEIGSVDPNNIVFNPMWQHGYAVECACISPEKCTVNQGMLVISATYVSSSPRQCWCWGLCLIEGRTGPMWASVYLASTRLLSGTASVSSVP